MGDESNEILQRLTRVETKLDIIINAKDIANEALQSANNANQRLDRVDKIIFWAGSTVIGGLIISALTLIFKTKGI